MSKFYICGITSTETDKISSLIAVTKEYCDGYVFCVDSNPNSDKTFELLDFNKEKGKIIRHFWQNAHDWQANEWLHCGAIKNGDWCLIMDSSECPTDYWIPKIKSQIAQFEKEGIGGIYFSNRIYLFRYFDHQFFYGTPHWGLNGIVGNTTTFGEENKDRYIINKRKLDPTEHWCLHNTKYTYCYGRSNQMQLTYEKYGQNIVGEHEIARLATRLFFQRILKLELNLSSLENYLKNTKPADLDKDLVGYFDYEFCMTEFYQIKVLGMDFMKDIVPRRYKWSFKNYIETGDGFSDPNYDGEIIKLNNRFNIKD